LNFFSLYKRQILFFLNKKINIDVNKNQKKTTLENLFIRYGSDKASTWNNKKNLGHGYTKYYLKVLEKLKKKNLNILEIGSYSGASAAAFSKFFPKSKIYCLDINISNFKYSSRKINVFGMDASDEKSYKNFLNKIGISNNDKFFDIIIDDGSHKLDDILKVLKIYFKHLKSKGFYIIEDYRLPNFFKHLNDANETKIDKLINFVKQRKYFKSKILNKSYQNIFFNEIVTIKKYHGLSKISDIVFFKKR
jgi:predicted O-methyltransferase YrrM